MTGAAVTRSPLEAMLEARSVAVVGAGARAGSFGYELMRQLRVGGFAGTVYPVNARATTIDGLTSLPSIADVPEPIDLAILGVGNDSMEAALQAAGERGCRAAVVFANCRDAAADDGRPLLSERLAAMARGFGMALCGGNCMGFINFDAGLRATGYSQASDLVPGPVTFLTHSGSAYSALLRNRRRIRFNLAVSSGDELVTTMAEYLDYALRLDTTRVVAVFMETVHDPHAFRDALATAAARDIPVVALKAGRGELARRMVTAHSGAVAGDDAAFEALFERHGVLRVRSLDELLDTVELLCANRRAPAGGLATVHDSGGERTHLVDVAEAAGVPLARVGAAATTRLAAALGPDLPPVNPVDAWSTSDEATAMFGACIAALHDDPDTAAVGLAVDLVADENPDSYLGIAEEAFATTTKPFFLLANVQSSIDLVKADRLRAAGIPVLEGTETAVRAVGHLFELRDVSRRRGAGEPVVTDSARAQRWADRLRHGHVGEACALRLLSDYGVPIVACREADDLTSALHAAEAIGWPVALKTAAANVAHKTDSDGVRLGLAGPDELTRAYHDVERRLGPRVVVQAMTIPRGGGIELSVGVTVDAQFGPLVVVAAGGVLVETLSDRAVSLPPVDAQRARAMLDRLRIRPLLDGARGREPVDRTALAAVITGVSQLAIELGDHLEAVDVNPVIASADGCVAVDALVIPAPQPRR